jgi:hypothetical protein
VTDGERTAEKNELIGACALRAHDGPYPTTQICVAHTTFLLCLEWYAAEDPSFSGRTGISVRSLDQRSSSQPRLVHVRVSGAVPTIQFRVSGFKFRVHKIEEGEFGTRRFSQKATKVAKEGQRPPAAD